MKHMILRDGVAYVEAPGAGPDAHACTGCHLRFKKTCGESVGVARAAFGRSCLESDDDFIYIKADTQPAKGLSPYLSTKGSESP